MEYTNNIEVMDLRRVSPLKLPLENKNTQEAEIFYPSKMNEVIEVEPKSVQPLFVDSTTALLDNKK